MITITSHRWDTFHRKKAELAPPKILQGNKPAVNLTLLVPPLLHRVPSTQLLGGSGTLKRWELEPTSLEMSNPQYIVLPPS